MLISDMRHQCIDRNRLVAPKGLLFAVRLPLLPTTQVPIATAPTPPGPTAALHRRGIGSSGVIPCSLPRGSDFFGTAALLEYMTGGASVLRQKRTLVVRPRATRAQHLMGQQVASQQEPEREGDDQRREPVASLVLSCRCSALDRWPPGTGWLLQTWRSTVGSGLTRVLSFDHESARCPRGVLIPRTELEPGSRRAPVAEAGYCDFRRSERRMARGLHPP